MTVPSRSLQLSSATNFRDLGGYIGAGGRTVKWRRLFRSDHLAELNQADRQTLHALGIQYTIDFRGAQERLAQSYHLEHTRQLSLPVEPHIVQRLQTLLSTGPELTAQQTHAWMQETYQAFVLNNQAEFKAFLHLLLERPDPLVFHCTAGKDRTGFAAALLLDALGVSHQDIMSDYLLTNALYQRPAHPTRAWPEDVMHVLWRVSPDFLGKAFETIDARYGSLQQYMQEALDIGKAEREHLQKLYLE